MSEAVPGLVRVMLTGVLLVPTAACPKATRAGAIPVDATGGVPVPVTFTVRIRSLADDGMVRAAAREPRPCGVKITPKVHDPPPFRDTFVQASPATEKSAGFWPVNESERTETGEVPRFVTVTWIAEDAIDWVCGSNAIGDGE